MSTSPQSAAIDEESRSIPAWKQEVNARLSAHRSRRTNGSERQPALPGLESDVSTAESRAARVAARVAERYSKAPTYSEMLAAEAANAARAASAAAQAAQEAHAAAQAILAGLDLPAHASGDDFADHDHGRQAPALEVVPPPAPEPPAPEPIRYHVNPQSLPEPRRSPERGLTPARPRISEIVDPFEDAVVVPAQPLPARLIEFPRELIATRKARPRIAEGPLRESGTEPDNSQLRIFEVEPEAISKEPVVDPVLPEWHSIRLDARPVEEEKRAERPPTRGLNSQAAAAAPPMQKRTARDLSHPYAALLEMLPLHVAPMEDRMMAAIVDTALVLVAFLLFVLVFVACTAHPPTGKAAMVSGGFVLIGFFVLYQWLFFNYGHGTPGMRYAKIALCTFDDENPSRKALRARVGGLLLSALPLGLGYLWALFDDDRLTWHDRMTQTYQRSYR